ncbi:MAG: hypothetical protein RLZZ188_902 [Verrucomicrobiota bacterium]
MVGHRRRDRARLCREAAERARRRLRLQRHQLHPPRGARADRLRPPARHLRPRGDLQPVAPGRHRLPAARGQARAHRPDGTRRRSHDPRRRARSDLPPDGGRGGTRRPLPHRRRPRPLLPHADQRRGTRRHPHPVRSQRRRDDARAERRFEPPRPRLGHRHQLLRSARPLVSRRTNLRPHRLDRHERVDRFRRADLCDLPEQPRPPRRQGRRHADPPRDRHARRRGHGPRPRRRAQRHRRAGAGGLRPAPRAARRPHHESQRTRPPGPRHDRPPARREGREARRALQPGARHPRQRRRARGRHGRREDQAADLQPLWRFSEAYPRDVFRRLRSRGHPRPGAQGAAIARSRCPRVRHPGHRRPLLHLLGDPRRGA